MSDEEYEINLLDYWRVIWKFRVLIIACFLVAVLAAGVISYRIPGVYEARTTLLPPTREVPSEVSYIFPSSPTTGSMFPEVGIETFSRIYVPILKSEDLARQVVLDLNLVEKFNTRTTEETVGILKKSVSISQTDAEFTEVKVKNRDPILAAEIANQYVQVMKDMVKEYVLFNIRQKRQFLEDRLKETGERLKIAEEALQKFRQTQGIAPFSQESRKITGRKQENNLSAFLELSRLEREVQIQESIYLMLAQEYEKTRITEAGGVPEIRVLDIATPPLRPIKPNIRLNIVIAGILSLFLSVFLAFFINYLQELKAGKYR